MKIHTAKSLTTGLTTNCDPETNTSIAEKIKNVSQNSEHNFEGGLKLDLPLTFGRE